MNNLAAPEFIRAILEWPWTWPLARFALVVTFLASGLSKIADFSGGVAEMAQAGMPEPAAMALLSIFVELTGSMLVLIGRWVWLGAGMLGSLHCDRRRNRARVLEGVWPRKERGDCRIPHALWADRRSRARRPSRGARRGPMKCRIAN
jgi:hypothetical protein